MHFSSSALRVQVYALSKERDALRRGSDKLSSAAGLLKEKDDIIQQARAQLSAQCACRDSSLRPSELWTMLRHTTRSSCYLCWSSEVLYD